MLRLKKISQVHEDLFAEHYERLFLWALQLTHHDRAQAEDLLHDAFIQFTITQPDLRTIKSIDGYLYGTLRNLQLSQVRKATRSRLQQLSIVEYESAETGLRSLKSTDPRDLIQAQDELRRVCHYVCVRKETARAASVLLLRFFHGYYPSEIAQILQTSSQAVRVRLRIARAEAKASLDNPKSLAFLGESPVAEVLPTGFARTSKDVLGELRQTIFASRRGDCLPAKRLRELYRLNKTPIETSDLAHIVSCETCLEAVNRILDLPSLAERSPIDAIDRDKGPKGGPPGVTGGGVSGGGGRVMSGWRRQAREVFEHDPQELCVSVNGYMQGSQKINSELSELTLDIDLAEPISFVEIFSEQQIRMLLMNVDEAPPEGPGEQSLRVGLSEDRTLELQLRFGSPWPTLHLAYHDPTFKQIESLTTRVQGEDTDSAIEVQESQTESSADKKPGLLAIVRQHWSRLRPSHWRFGPFLKPGAVTAVAALLLIAALLLMKLHRGPETVATAPDLLSRAASIEESIAARTDQVVHRTINLEERSNDGTLIALRKIEVWQSAEKGIIARRLFDQHGRLIAGDWRRNDGVQTLYHHGARPQLQLVPEKRGGQSAITFDNAWLLDLAATEFTRVIGRPGRTRVEERPNTYVITYKAQDSAPSAEASVSSVVNYLVAATLVMNRNDLHPIEQTLVLRQGNETREYRFIETVFNQKPRDSVAPKVFEPEPELLGTDAGTRRIGETEKITASPRLPVPASPAATAEDEVEVLRLLNQAGVFLRDQVSVNRSPAGQLIVSGIVENDERKQQIVSALAPVTKSRVARVEVETVTEVLQRQQARAASAPIQVEGVQVTEARIPVDAEVRKFLADTKGLTIEQLDVAVRQFAERMMARSNQARLHALALKPVIERFSPEELQTLSDDARAKWRAIIVEHVRAFAAETAALHRELESVFPSLGSTPQTAAPDITSDTDLIRAVRQLMQMASANDDAVNRSFSISANSNRAAPVKTTQFWKSLASAEYLAAKIRSR